MAPAPAGRVKRPQRLAPLLASPVSPPSPLPPAAAPRWPRPGSPLAAPASPRVRCAPRSGSHRLPCSGHLGHGLAPLLASPLAVGRARPAACTGRPCACWPRPRPRPSARASSRPFGSTTATPPLALGLV
nr:potassium/sodium hyperpolarization-activated cyclic nucleotide-gated channel 2-like [Aegilops tauschii subsp. strangulata]